MRYKIEGTHSLEEMKQILQLFFDKTLVSLGVSRLSGVSLYLTPRDADGQAVMLVDADGKELDLLYRVPRPEKKAKAPRKPASD